MTPLAACWDGMRRVNHAPALLAAVWAMTLIVSLPLALAIRGTLARHLGRSVAADTAASGINYDWMQEFSGQATGLGATFSPAITGFGAVIGNLSAFMDNEPPPIAVLGAGSVYVVLWIFLAGGIIDRYAGDRATGLSRFISVSGAFFWRLGRLGVVQWIIYACLFGVIHPTLFDRLYPLFTQDVAIERTAFLIRVFLYLVFAVLVALAIMVFDYAKVRTVVEDRQSVLGAIHAALDFLRHHLAAGVVLFLANVALLVAAIGVYGVIAPEAGNAGIRLLIGLAVSQLYVVGRLWVKLVFWASETALFQSRIAADAGTLST